MWRLRSTSCEDAKSLRPDIVLKLEVFREGDLKRPAETLFFAMLVFSGEENLHPLLFIFLLKIADFGESLAGVGVSGGVSRSSAAEDRRVPPLFFPIFFAQFQTVRSKSFVASFAGIFIPNRCVSLAFLYFFFIINILGLILEKISVDLFNDYRKKDINNIFFLKKRKLIYHYTYLGVILKSLKSLL